MNPFLDGSLRQMLHCLFANNKKNPLLCENKQQYRDNWQWARTRTPKLTTKKGTGTVLTPELICPQVEQDAL
jgi:hypothetical protein